ncbi:MAG: bifunctional 4-hydroxy-2-oxoglutarate aldolase/2-dehydro-3-deoxy-phosphogluconate aldolase [Candidatus Nitronauta litoralis]|uniref:Bifunctional 4-hydroxy-2-oxoglutarate aldolase/2-dehydro-3-deoxy-phosphogluconate aldolase n=1 Tax=Candidatus Nitronauta litoralis TaxID=2705533 RepID=A0A7T0G1E3_9BACT|nr:MAG: bifunctional 4-hydroxy-2-oxoglutarate aldolase/2-dehydro-3-deoxy-phosphogluconate aldolase [Candidatus Nitronauta litoralis]
MSGQVFNLNSFLSCPVMGILRGISLEQTEPVLEAAHNAGLRYVEVTLNTPDAFTIIKNASRTFAGRFTFGAGTVLSVDEARQALDSGATFLVSPTLNETVAAFCAKEKVAYFPGAFTPTEIERAWNASAAMVKVFPASQLGPGYFKEIKGPFSDIKMMAVGGVRAGNAHEYLKSGAKAVAVGGSIFSRERLASGDTASIQKDLQEILFAVRGFFTKMSS